VKRGATWQACNTDCGCPSILQAKRAYRALSLSGYARIDIRVDADGKTYVLEANPNPQLAYGEDFAESAAHAGIAYRDLLQKIVNLGLSWRPERPG